MREGHLKPVVNQARDGTGHERRGWLLTHSNSWTESVAEGMASWVVWVVSR